MSAQTIIYVQTNSAFMMISASQATVEAEIKFVLKNPCLNILFAIIPFTLHKRMIQPILLTIQQQTVAQTFLATVTNDVKAHTVLKILFYALLFSSPGLNWAATILNIMLKRGLELN
ncbi:hypothetical protein FGO68_gene6180 [Halteria grandinella]|uniref:Uncharacterized protein n=1 Tax=Halteria grandinella TaxID=5974 RepID=A0A8J8T6C0_HALGN|nr:hypothetical protein FGO68_gene6180 [Halteria grandinella]